MIKAQIPSIKVLLSTPQNIVIVPHKNPDGDAMGSTLGLYHYLISSDIMPLSLLLTIILIF
jgi:phosphoesterase RecJ-like protein